MLKMLKFSKTSYAHYLGIRRYLNPCRYQPIGTAKFSSLSQQKVHQQSDVEKFQKGDVIEGFTVTETARIDEMYLTAVRLTHMSTGAQYLHLARDDSNNVFSTAFRTTPMDSTGLPHILEHTTTCGSERYPSRDPFFKMLRRSLATFMNALTGPDYTMYPFSTQNLKDFRNLQSVYLDFVFRPNLRELDFRQEGWRLEHADVNDKNSPIIFKGVVFNEMKGVFNQNQAIFAEKLLNSLLPSHTYSVISGGDPLEIPKLEHSDLVNFHANYYHPSNARFYSYGNFPLEDHLKFLNELYLSSADRIDTSKSIVPSEKRWEKPRMEHVACRPDPMIADPNRQGSIAIAHLCNVINDTQKTFELYVLSQLLLKGPNSAFYKSLVDTNIGTGFGPVTGFDSQCKDTMFVVSLQGVKTEDFEKIQKIYDQTVQKVIEEGFAKDHIEAVLHSIELAVKHQTSNFGLNLLFNVTPLWNHDGDIIQSLRINQAVNKLTEALKEDPKYLQKLVETYLLNNTHKLTLTMLPDEKYDECKSAAENQLLQEKLKSLSKEEIDKIYEDGQILLAEQQKQEDPNILPTLKIADLKPDVDRYEVKDLSISGVPVQLAVQPTNGVCYYRGILNIRELSPELKTLVPLFNDVIAKMGTKNYDYRSFDQMIELKTGGLHFMNHIAEHRDSMTQYEEGILIESHCLERNANDMWKLWTELFNNVKLTDLQRFETLVKMNAAHLVNNIAHAGHIYAMSSAASLVSPVSRLKESLSGLQHIAKMKKIAQLQNLSPVLEQVQEIAENVLNKKHLRSAINLSAENKESIIKSMESFYESLKGKPHDPYVFTNDEDTKRQESAIHFVLPYTVNYSAKAIATVPYTNPDYAALRVLSKLITSMYLHPEIREKGGAYGGGAKLTSEGIFGFYSYRDPNSTRTFDVYDKAYDFLLKNTFTQADIDEAKLGVFQHVDNPTPPSDRGMTKFLHNLTDDDLQRHREQLKAVTKDQLMNVAEKYLKPGNENLKIGRTLIGPANEDLSARCSENWQVLNQEEETQAQMAK